MEEIDFDPEQFENAILLGIKKAYGLFGAAIQITVIHFDKANRIGYVKTRFETSPKVLASIVLITDYAGIPIKFQILGQSPCLASLV